MAARLADLLEAQVEIDLIQTNTILISSCGRHEGCTTSFSAVSERTCQERNRRNRTPVPTQEISKNFARLRHGYVNLNWPQGDGLKWLHVMAKLSEELPQARGEGG